MKNLVCILKEGCYSILLAKDNHKGISIQVSMLMDKFIPNLKGEMVRHKTQLVVGNNYIAIEVDKKINEKFEQHLIEGIKSARILVAKFQSQNKNIDTILETYRKNNEKLNDQQKDNS